MVLKKRLDCGFNGFQVPTIPRAPRSARRRGPHKKSVEDEQICAFELLASLAGKLLQESESSASSNASEGNSQPTFGKDVKQEREDENRLPKKECLDQGSSEESASLGLTSQNIDRKCIRKEFPHANSDAVLEGTSIIANSDISAKPGGHMKSVICSSRSTLQNYSGKVDGVSPGIVESCYGNVANGIQGQQNSELLETGALTRANTCSSKELTDLHAKYPAMLNGDNNVKLSLFRDPIPNASFSRHRNGIELGCRDDDENFSRCIKPRNKVKASRPPPRVGDRRIRKLLTSKYWKVAPKLRDCEHYRYDGGIKPNYQKRKAFYNWERSQRDTLYKRRKLVDRSSVVTSDGGFSGESVSNSPDKGDKKFPAANGISASVIGHQASFRSKESHVKFRIKSFRVPELFIEVSETETVGSLKRTVMEAVNSILRGGLSVGVLVQGKKVRDDNINLLQTGISSKDNLDSLGFTLEPSHVQASPSFFSADPPPSLSCETSVLLTRSPCTPVLDSGMSDVLSDPPPLTTNSGSLAESNHESVSSHIDISTNKTMLESQALVAIPKMSMEPLAVVPLNQKIKRPELVQRRTRRPFSVSEVEALVQAVEELGTGRWRDVKLRAFENADHRTYVDLKDKWKTLVHTAQISPQQRRGEPVPQELLDRVLAAHSYWCQHQAKQHGKLQGGILKITETAADRHGAERYPLV